MDSLADRVTTLELAVGRNGESDVPLRSRVAELNTQYRTITHHQKQIADFLASYESLSTWLEGSSMTLSDDINAEMVLEAEAGCSQMTDLLSNIKQNEKYIDQSEREALQVARQRVRQLIPIHRAQLQTADALSERIDRLIQHYNDIAAVVSEQFLVWDASLRRMEEEIDRIASS